MRLVHSLGPAMQQPWYQRHAVLLCLGVLLLIQWGAWQLIPGPAQPWVHGGEVADDVLKTTKLEGIQFDNNTKQYSTKTQQGQITWPAGAGAGLLYLSLTADFEGTNTAPQWLLQYTTHHQPLFDEGLIHTRSLRPLLKNMGGQTTLSWNLPVGAENIRLLIPPNTKFSTGVMYLAGIVSDPFSDDYSWHPWRQALVLLCFAVNLSLFFTWLSQYLAQLRRFLAQPACISILLLGIQGVTMIWLLPPFLGPDENRHWKAAVKLYRSDGQKDSVLYRLPVILDAESPRWQSERHFHAANLFAVPHLKPDGETKGVGYVKHWGYPIVGLVSLLFPSVHTVSEALVFYYTCRVLALLLLLLLVACAWRMGLGSWTLIVFLSFPIVLQQCVIVSTDTAHNLGTFLAILLFRRHQLVNTKASWLMLFLVCCLVVMSKPPIYLTILILPAWFLPLRRASVWLPLLMSMFVVGAVGVWWLWKVIINEGIGLDAQARLQLEYILTGPGIGQFFFAGMEYPTRFFNPVFWWEPMGWLDTNINDLHKSLLWISLLLALTFDLVRWLNWLRTAVEKLPERFLISLVLSLVHLLFVWWSLALVMYLTISDYKSPGIVGMQVRYMIPVALLFILWPACFTEKRDGEKKWEGNAHAELSTVWHILPPTILLVLAITRTVQLSSDLLIRFW